MNQTTTSKPIVRHAACDSCRARKLKCSGNYPSCARCAKDAVACIYSAQKPMGRPRKRRHEGGSELEAYESTDQPEATASANGMASLFSSTPSSWSLPSLPDFFADSLLVDDPNGADIVGQDTVPVDPHLLPISPDHIATLDLSHSHSIDPSYDHAAHTASNGEWIVPSCATSASQLPCACLSRMYLSLAELQSLFDLAFPYSLPTLRSALHTARDVLYCNECPKRPNTGMANVQLMGVLFTAVGERFRALVQVIDDEADQALAGGTKKLFQMGDLNPERRHLHVAGAGPMNCPGSFCIDLEPEEWRLLAKRAVRAEVLGPKEDGNSLGELLTATEERQQAWHRDASKDHIRATGFGQAADGGPNDYLCLRILKESRSMVERIRW